jgi:competence protein ComEA
LSKYSPQHLHRISKHIQISIIIISIILIAYIIISKLKPPESFPFTDIEIENTKQKKAHNYTTTHIRTDTIIDINSATYEELTSIGIPKKQAHIIINYRNKGGVFYTKKDILTIYGLNQYIYDKIKKQIQTTARKRKQRKTDYTKKKYKTPPLSKNINLNTCNASELQSIYMIGEYRSEKIIEYRKKLGGYYTFVQLEEVFSLDSTAIIQITKRCYIDTLEIRKININTAAFQEILEHPYSDYYISKDIFLYKKITGKIKSIDELETNNIIKKEEYERLHKYLRTF